MAGTDASSRGPWKNANPTPIEKPTTNVSNPYSRMTGTHNPSAKSITGDHRRKQQYRNNSRPGSSAYQECRPSSKSTPRGRQLGQLTTRPPSDHKNIIELDLDDEDTGRPVQRPESTHSKVIPVAGPSSPYNSTYTSDSGPSHHARHSLPQDGESTKRMQAKLSKFEPGFPPRGHRSGPSARSDDSYEPITEYQEESPKIPPTRHVVVTKKRRTGSPNRQSITAGGVQQRVKGFEEMNAKSGKPLPHIVFEKRTSKLHGKLVVSAMKGRAPNTHLRVLTSTRQTPDPSTSSTQYIIKLPIIQWITGREMSDINDKTQELEWGYAPSLMRLTSSRGHTKTIPVADIIKGSVHHTGTDVKDTPRIVRLQLCDNSSPRKGSELVTIRFSTVPETTDQFGRFVRELTKALIKKGDKPIIEGSPDTVKALLNEAVNNATVPVEEVSRREPRAVSPEVPLPSPTKQLSPEKKRDRQLTYGLRPITTIRRSTRHHDYGEDQDYASSPQGPTKAIHFSKAHTLNPDEVILVYPQNGPGAVNITNGDLKRLDPGEFLNDTLIELGLKFWFADLKDKAPDIAEEVHIFNSFFYKKLNTKNLEEGCNSVKKWTSKLDIFKKKYIIVPINENVHWYLAIICHPEHILKSTTPKPPVQPTRSSQRLTDMGQVQQPALSKGTKNTESDNTMTPSRTISPVSKSTKQLNGDEEDKMEGMIESTRSISIDEDFGSVEGGGPSGRSTIDSSIYVESSDEEQDIPEGTIDEPASDRETEHQSSKTPSKGDVTVPSVAMDVDEGEESERNHAALDEDPQLSDISEQAQVPGSVSVDSFYGRTEVPKVHPATSYGKKRRRQSSVSEVEDEVLLEKADILFEPEECTYIFTFDSLGSKHPRAAHLLKNYLQFEAKDKKQIEDPSEAKYKMALVPAQPNYCDCGLYLLHFVKTFMSEPLKYMDVILSGKKSTSVDRSQTWLADSVPHMREEMAKRILEKSEAWKAERASGEKVPETSEEVKNTSDSKRPTKVDEDSDDDIVVGEVTKVIPPKSQTRGRKSGGTQSAARLRG